MLDHPLAATSDNRQRFLSNYKGKYEIVKKAAQNIKNLKPEAEKLYYLAAELNLQKVTNELSEHSGDISLKSY